MDFIFNLCGLDQLRLRDLRGRTAADSIDRDHSEFVFLASVESFGLSRWKLVGPKNILSEN